VLKCIGIDERYQGLGVSARIVTHLIRGAHRRGRDHLFLFTKPSNVEQFSGLGFRLIANTKKAALLESGTRRIEDFLPPEKPSVPAAAIVVNCNPFTLGHRHLIEQASLNHPLLFVFVLEEEASLFPFSTRLELVRRGVADLPNVRVLPSGPYVISQATFPSYFLRDAEKAAAHVGLDATIFASRIAPAFGIVKRYVGEEPFCETTRQYNEALSRILAAHGISFEVLPRKEAGGKPISASTVRRCLRDGDFSSLASLVPATTLDFLKSDEALPIIQRIQTADSPH
ncbi:MAG: [citrate (pro-3S)-lyase] ligase, partial [Bacteroidota bacterium]